MQCSGGLALKAIDFDRAPVNELNDTESMDRGECGRKDKPSQIMQKYWAGSFVKTLLFLIRDQIIISIRKQKFVFVRIYFQRTIFMPLNGSIILSGSWHQCREHFIR